MGASIFADTHSNIWFNKCLQTIKNSNSIAISLGDLAAVDTTEFLKHRGVYSATWNFKKNGCTSKDINVRWFDELNI